VSRSLDHLRVRKHWKFRLAMLPVELALIGFGYTRGSGELPFLIAAGVLTAATSLPYWSSDARAARNLKARKARTLP
jgi:hypothetical protein